MGLCLEATVCRSCCYSPANTFILVVRHKGIQTKSASKVGQLTAQPHMKKGLRLGVFHTSKFRHVRKDVCKDAYVCVCRCVVD